MQKSGKPYQNVFVYDQMNRLVEAVQNGKSEKYTYDLAGNRLKKESEQKTEHYQYNRKNQLIHLKTGETTTQYRYDQQGNLLEEQSNTWNKTYTYDAENRQRSTKLTQISNGTPEYFHQSNHYDGEGFRYKTEENGKIIRFLFDRGELAEEIQEDTHISYTRGNVPLALSRNGTNQNYFVSDEMGSTLFLLDQKHEIRKMYHYNAFGVIKEETGDVSNRLTYTGQIYDSVTGQYYLRARFYNPSIGRFTQEDIYRGSGLNLYAYCANNPVMYYDPSGYIQLPCAHKYTPSTSPYASTIDVKVFGKNSSSRGLSYEDAIRNIIYANIPHIDGRKFIAMINGEPKTGYADYLIIQNKKLIPIEAKYVDDWNKSFRNPEYPILDKPWASGKIDDMLEQATKYSVTFSEVIYHTNSMELANCYTKLFKEIGVNNFEFVITPTFR